MSASTQSQQPTGHPERWRRLLTTSEPGAPWVTYYQPETGARVELSRATFDNWVSKAAWMLEGECEVEPGSRVLLDLEPHWLLPVWAWATWALGATVVLPGGPTSALPPAEVCITDNPDTRCAAATMLLSTRHALGLPTQQPPSGTVDALADIRAYPDSRPAPVPDAAGQLITDGEESVAVGPELVEILQATPIKRAALLRARPNDSIGLARALLGPAFHRSALVIVDGGSEADLEAIRVQEHVDVDID